MVKSMTGYGRSVAQTEDSMTTVEIRSVNHRYLDIQCTLPSSLLFLEEKLKDIIRSYFARGHIEIMIRQEGTGVVSKKLETDWELLNQYMEQFKQIKDRYQLSGDIPVTVLSSIPDLFVIRETKADSDEQLEMIVECMETACSQLQTKRQSEGEKLLADITTRMNQFQSFTKLLQTQRDKVREDFHDRVHQRIRDYAGDKLDTDNTRLFQEVALLAEKGDITEEVTRLHSHIDHFFAIIEQEEQIGRRLDFILQEMHRETNTIGSKSTDPKMSEWIVSMKSELEKMKEQIQNME